MDAIIDEVARLRAQVTALQSLCTKQLVELRAARRGQSELDGMVQAFHDRFEQPIGATPRVPTDAWVRLRAKLTIEEAFELVAALFGWADGQLEVLKTVERDVVDMCQRTPVDVDMPAAIDAMADIGFVNQGCFITFGVDAGPVYAAVYRANMAKGPSPTEGWAKPVKPAGWLPPDIASVLRAQGWDDGT